MKKIFWLCLFFVGPALAQTAPENCGISLYKLSTEYGRPGDTFTMQGVWGKEQGEKLVCINRGGRNLLEIIRWSERELEVRIPDNLPFGEYKVGAYCVDPYKTRTNSTGWRTFHVVETLPEIKKEVFHPAPAPAPQPKENSNTLVTVLILIIVGLVFFIMVRR